MSLECQSCHASTASPVILIPKTGFSLDLCPDCAAGIRKPEIPKTRAELQAYLDRHKKTVDQLKAGTAIRKVVGASEATVLKVKRAMKALKEAPRSAAAPAAAPRQPTPAPRPAAPPPPPVVDELPDLPDFDDTDGDDEDEFDKYEKRRAYFKDLRQQAKVLVEAGDMAAAEKLLTDAGLRLITREEQVKWGYELSCSDHFYAIPNDDDSVIDLENMRF